MAKIIENKEIEPMNLNSRTLTRNFHYSSSLICFIFFTVQPCWLSQVA